MSNTRIERDSMGELQVPAEALYGAQTQRAVNNFPISHQRMPAQFIRALILAKAAAAKVNVDSSKSARRRARPSSTPPKACWKAISCRTSRWISSRPAPAPVPT